MKNQGQGQQLYRGNDNKKVKITQSEKIDNFIKKMKLKAAKDASARGTHA